MHTCKVVYLVGVRPGVSEAIISRRDSIGSEVVIVSAQDFLDFNRVDGASCLILDLHPQDHHGFARQCELAGKACPPVIFICGHSDVSAAARAMKAGAVELLTLPLDPTALVDAIKTAFLQDRKLRQRRAEQAELRERFLSLTPREREVLPFVVGGLLNKQSASMLGISEVTLQIHRSQVIRKMQAESLADLVRMAIKLRLPYHRENRTQPRTGPTLIEIPDRHASHG